MGLCVLAPGVRAWGGNLALAPGDEFCPTFPFSPARECLGFSLSLLSLREA